MLRRALIASILLSVPLKARAMWPFDKSGQMLTTTTPSGIRIKDMPSDRPKFERVYTARITPEISIKVSLRTSGGSYGASRYDMSELDQRDGKWVLFDLKAPADKILDRELLPHVQKACAEIIALDKTYLASDPNEFVDEGGVRWRRVDVS